MNRAVRIIDFETSGMEPPEAKVVEFALCDVIDAGEGWKIGANRSWLHRVDEIPPEVRAVHHISAKDVAGFDPFDPALMWIDAQADGIAVVGSHNWDFDGKFAGKPELPTLCTYKAALRVFPEAPSHSNGALRYWLEDQGLIAPQHDATMPPHRAGPDAYVTAHILLAMLQRGVTVAEMVAWTREPRLLPTCPIGEWRGKPWAQVDHGFLRWMINKPVEPDLVWNAQRELERRRAAA